MARQPLVIAPGSSAGAAPEDTAGAFDLAIRAGADVITADFTPTKDGTLVALADHELSALTNVADRPEFAGRKETRTIEGEDRTGWFAEDFTLAELKVLTRGTAAPRRKSGAPPQGDAILTFEEIVAIARAGSVRTARVVGVQAGLSRSAYFAGLDMAVEPLLANAIRVAGYNSPAAAMFVTSADPASLKAIGELTRARRVLRLTRNGQGGDVSADGLKAIRGYAEVVAPDPALLLDFPTPKTVKATPLFADAHAAGLAVQAWTMGAPFPGPPLKIGDAGHLLALLFAWGADAIAGPRPAEIVRARNEAMAHAAG
jgi:glycerophosphoryl diester phosphodiesterase